MKHRLAEYLVVDQVKSKEVICCSSCQYIFGLATENPKNNPVVKEFPMAREGTFFPESDRFILREFYCPGCGTMFDVEVNLKKSPYIWDARLSS